MIYITTLEDLQNIKNDLNNDYVLVNDIDAMSTSTWNDGLGFEPIGNATTRFNGTFDGGNFTIDGLYINRPTEPNIGLFGFVGFTSAPTKVVIKNLNIVNSGITGSDNVGILSGYVLRALSITNIFTNGQVYSDITNGGTCGGLIGRCGNRGVTVTYCKSSADVYGLVTGGLIGAALGNVSFSFSTGKVYTTVSFTADPVGMAGGLFGTSTAFVNQCFSSAEVSCEGNVIGGGFVGEQGSASHIVSCYSDGKITGDTSGSDSGCIGGFVGSTDGGSNGYIHGCHVVGLVSSNGYKGGFVGYNKTIGVISTNCFWDTEKTNQINGFDGLPLDPLATLIGLTTEQMTNVSNFPINTVDDSFINWNTDEWIFCDYPLLKWDDPVCPGIIVDTPNLASLFVISF